MVCGNMQGWMSHASYAFFRALGDGNWRGWSQALFQNRVSIPPSSAASATFLNSGYRWIRVSGASTLLPLIIALSSSAFTPALLSKWLLVMT